MKMPMLFLVVTILAVFNIAWVTVVVATKPVINIVIYDKIKGYLNWPQDWFRNATRHFCPSTTCLLHDYDQSILSTADVILFHAPTYGQQTIPPPKKKTTVPSTKVAPSLPLHALMSMEQPKYAPLLSNFDGLNKKFDLLITYSLEHTYPNTIVPNLPVTYYPLNLVSAKAVLQPPRPLHEKIGDGVADHSKNTQIANSGDHAKSLTIAVFMSNCKAAGAAARFKYVEELMRLVDVHSYGTCLHNRAEPSLPDDPHWPPQAQRRARKIKVLSRYKFYLAFENYAIDDYVSEKVFEGLIAGAVPVYRGSASIDKFMPSPSSYINANDMTPQQLAELLVTINDNETRYNSYFEFKKQPLSPSFLEITEMSFSHPNAVCRLCDYALQQKATTTAVA